MPKSNNLVVIGNPPYQLQTESQQQREVIGAEQAKPIYNLFIETIIDSVKPNLFSMIVPSRWMVGGMGLDSFRERMMNDKKIKIIKNFVGSKEVFKEAEIGGGVNYFLWDVNYDDACNFFDGNSSQKRNLDEFEIIVQDNIVASIFRKVLANSTKFVSDRVYSRKPFGLSSNFSDFSPEGYRCYVVDKSEKFVDQSKFTDKNNILGKYKVVMAGASGFFREAKYTVGNPFILRPNEICTETFIVMSSFDSIEECENFVKYAHTKFFKILLWQRLTTQNNSKKCYQFVPDQEDYTREYTDEYLYKKYNLTEEEIAYIEKKIKS